jgi:transposase
MAVAIKRQDLSANELRREAARSRDTNATRRMLAISLVMEGHSRENAADMYGMDRRTLGDRVHRYNVEGSAGLSSRHCPRSKRAPFIAP